MVCGFFQQCSLTEVVCMAFINVWSWKETPQHLGRQRPLWEDRGGVAVFWSSQGGQSVGVFALQKELDVTCGLQQWQLSFSALPQTDVPGAVKNWSLAFSWGSVSPWEQCCSTGILHPSRRQFLTTCLFLDFLPYLSLQPPKQCLDASKIELVMVLKGCWIITFPNSSPMFCATKLIKISPEQLKKRVWQYFKNLVKAVKYWNVKARINSQRDLSKAVFFFFFSL